MVKLLFVFPNEPFLNPPPVSIAIFNSLLKNEDGVELKIFDTTMYQTELVSHDKLKEKMLQVRPFDFKDRGIVAKASDPEADFVALVDSYQPDIIAVTCNEITSALAFSLMRKVKEHSSVKVVGGVYPTFAPEEFLREGLFDYVCRGEGEGVILDIVRRCKASADLRDIDNLCYERDGEVVMNPLRALSDINHLPRPDYDIFEEGRYFRPMAGKVWRLFPIETSRGCMYNCSFCSSPSQKKLYDMHGSKRFFRKKSIPMIDAELDYVTNVLGAEYIYFLSDTLLCLSNQEFKEFAKMYSRYNLPFWCQNRPEMISYEKVKILKDIGCHRMSMGIEHGNETFRREVLKKKLSNDAVIRAFEAVEKVGVPVTANNIIGFPGETRELAFDTINLNRKITFDTTTANAFTPFHGTELYNVCVRDGLFSGEHAKCISKGSILSMPQFTKEEINGLIRTFVLYVKMPESYYDRIKIAEECSEEGDAELLRLTELCTELNS